MKRVFFAVDISDSDKQNIAKWREDIACNANAVNGENFHITLAFLGQLNEEQISLFIQFVNQINPTHQTASFSLTVNKLANFNNAKVTYLSFKDFPDAITKLAYLLMRQAKKMNITQQYKHYSPHLTLYRKSKLVPTTPAKQLAKLSVNSFSLYHSFSTTDGVKYQPIKTWPLWQL